MSYVIRVGENKTIKIPGSIAEKLGIREGDKIILEVVGGSILLKPMKTNVSRIARGFWGEVSAKDVESEGE